ncbi:MAG TPA: DUF3997 domain-containing protein [Flavitalea sp.]|nr:DUF3997 domain-containing protein [Flavitalea sp.]
MKALCYLLMSLYLFIQFGCIGVAHNEKLIKNYFLGAFDIDEELSLQAVDSSGYAFDVVPATVYAVGFNDEYIIAKQHPLQNPENKSVTNYFIVPIGKPPKSYEHHELWGPLTIAEFEAKRKELGINFEFSKIFKSLE